MLVWPGRCHHLVRWQRNDLPGSPDPADRRAGLRLAGGTPGAEKQAADVATVKKLRRGPRAPRRPLAEAVSSTV